MATYDGGRTWTRATNPCSRFRTINNLIGASLASRSRGWTLCVGEPGVGQESKAIFETDDGGHSWSRRASAVMGGLIRGGLGAGGYAEGIAVDPRGRGVLWESRGALFVTRDGGRHWTNAGLTRYDVDFGISASVTLDRYYVLIVGLGGFRLFVSGDRGTHWLVVHRWR